MSLAMDHPLICEEPLLASSSYLMKKLTSEESLLKLIVNVFLSRLTDIDLEDFKFLVTL